MCAAAVTDAAASDEQCFVGIHSFILMMMMMMMMMMDLSRLAVKRSINTKYSVVKLNRNSTNNIQ